MRKENNPYNERGSFKCKKCGEEFRTSMGLWKHLQEGKCDKYT